MAVDLKLIETFSGGDLVQNSTDLELISGFGNMIYLALFGGNVEQSTPTRRIASEQYFDFWGNSLFANNNQSIQFNSETERTLRNVALNSQGRILIIEAIKKDLSFFITFANVIVDVIINESKVILSIKIIELSNNQQSEFEYIWDGTKKDLENE